MCVLTYVSVWLLKVSKQKDGKILYFHLTNFNNGYGAQFTSELLYK